MRQRDAVLTGKEMLQRLMAAVRRPAAPVRVDDIVDSAAGKSIVDQFHVLWYGSEAAAGVTWQGQPVLKSPFDLWMYQQLITSTRPDVIIETGTHRGGSALFFSDVARLAGHDMDVITIDFNPKLAYDPAPHRIFPIAGISTAGETIDAVRTLLSTRHSRPPTVMAVLDSDHSKQNVLDELRLYAGFVSVGQWLVVEDTNVNGHPVLPGHGDGPYEAVADFLRANPAFEPDRSCERFLFTQNPGGWLRRVRN